MLSPDRRAILDEMVSKGTSLTEIRDTAGFDPRTVKRAYPGYRGAAPPGRPASPERMAELAKGVEDGLSFNEMRRKYGVDYRTIKRNFPDYMPHTPGGGGDAAVIRDTNVKLRDFLEFGKVRSNKW